MIFAIELEKYMADTDIFSIVIGKFCHGKKLYLIILLEINKSLEVGFYYTILPFGFTVRLWLESGGEFLFNAKKIV